MLELDTKLEQIYGIGPKSLKTLKTAGLKTIQDLLYYFPFRWENWTSPININHLRIDEEAVIKAQVLKIDSSFIARKKMTVIKAKLADQSGEVEAIWFNQPYLKRFLRSNSHWYFLGKLAFFRQKKVFMVKAQEQTAQIKPIYHQISSLKTNFFRRIIKNVLTLAKKIDDLLPGAIISQFSLTTLPEAIHDIHAPENSFNLTKAKRRLAFDELLMISLALLNLRKKIQSKKTKPCPAPIKELKNFTQSLPFNLTNDQRKAAWQIILDMQKKTPMNRLLQGDVGAGKTVVALMAAICAMENQSQVAWLAPTTILAHQHYETAKKLLPSQYNISLLTSATFFYNRQKIIKEKLIKKLEKQKSGLVIATHALLAKNINLTKTNLLIIDEQHRFGVKQRSQLIGQNKTLHFLSMTATPIPRTLSLTLYGDLETSIIREKPLGRKPIITRLVNTSLRSQTYKFIQKKIEDGQQAFIICPLIEEADPGENLLEIDKKSVQAEYKKISQQIFPQFKTKMLHGKMKAAQKQKIMKGFIQGKSQILISTAVIEVGIDVPNASIMMIESADRFGLAQLHQFRGRVGRGGHQSYCFLLSDNQNEKTLKRLEAMERENDGFKLAEIDLKMRGPGIISGVKQSGFQHLKLASIFDTILLSDARQVAQIIIDKGLSKYPLLYEKVKNFTKHQHLE